MKIATLFLALFIFCFQKVTAQGTWHNLGEGVSCNGNCGPNLVGVYAICPDTIHNALYVGGIFNTAGSGLIQYGLTKWDGTQWDSVPTYLGGGSPMIMYRDTLYVGNFAKYDGNKFYSLPSFNGTVNCFAIYKDTLYAGGSFTKAGNVSVNNIAKWNGKYWMQLGSGIYGSCCPAVNAMTVNNDTLFVGGYFSNAGNQSTKGIAKWDGTNWQAVGGGIGDYNFQGLVNALETFKGELYAGGDFDSAGGKLIRGIGVWNGIEWDTLNSSISSEVFTLKSFDGYLFIGGDGAWFLEDMAKYDGYNITTVDSGVNELVFSFGGWNGSLYVGGEFNFAGKTDSTNHIARWTPDSTTGIKQIAKDNERVGVYPNPTSNQLRFSSSSPIKQIQVEDVLGQTLIEQNFVSGFQKKTIDVSALSAGIYFYHITYSESHAIIGKFIKE